MVVSQDILLRHEHGIESINQAGCHLLAPALKFKQ
jgi:hypothetical protein